VTLETMGSHVTHRTCASRCPSLLCRRLLWLAVACFCPDHHVLDLMMLRALIDLASHIMQCRPWLSARMKVTALAMAYFFYPDVTNQILQIFSCRQVSGTIMWPVWSSC
jgi:hypothetical protein